MISVSGKKWQEKIVDNRLVEKIQQNYNLTNMLSRLIVTRNFNENEIHLINNDLNLKNIFQKNQDFIRSVDLVEKAIKNKENICILGDYDVDGSASTSLLIRFFKNINHPFYYYIPDRVKDGYGASKRLFEKLIKRNPKLIIMVDCGSTASKAIEYLNNNKIKSLIIDHHEITKPYPEANVIINPKKNDGYIEYDYFCATTLTYFFLDMLIKKIRCEMNLKKYLIYVLLATVCDVMPLRKLNRLIAISALKNFNLHKNNAFNELYKINNKKNKININDLGYLIGPILNSGGRLGKSNYATELLSSEDNETINQRVLHLNELNNRRKKIETLTLNQIDFKEIEKKNEPIIFYYNPNINEGLIGIIAARLKDYFNKPSIVITNSNNLLKSSARSIFNYNIGRAIRNSILKEITISGGGHNMAAGFTLDKEKLTLFKKFIFDDFLNSRVSLNSSFEYDFEISSNAFNNSFFNEVNKIAPFGNGNPLPKFLIKDLKVVKSSIIKGKYISCILKSKTNASINSIYFDYYNSIIREYLLNYKKNFTVIGQINQNFWNNKKTLQLIIKDLIL